MSTPINSTRKDQILAVAAKLFHKKGYDASSMRDIANELNIEAASLYHHIKSKEEILDQICFGMADKFLSAIAEVNDIYFNAEERLRMAIQHHVDIITRDQDKSAVFLREWRSLPETSRQIFVDLRHRYEHEFTAIVENGMEEDVFEHVDKKFAVLSILSSVNWIVEWYQPDGDMTPKEIASKISDFILGGLRKKFITDPHYRP